MKTTYYFFLAGIGWAFSGGAGQAEVKDQAAGRTAGATYALVGPAGVVPGESVSSSSAKVAVPGAGWRPDRILVMPRRGVTTEALAGFEGGLGCGVFRRYTGVGGLEVVSVPAEETVPGLIAKFQQSGLVEYAEPDYVRHLDLTPNDPLYANGTLWGLNNTGQNGGLADADIDAPEGWDVLSMASNIVVAVLDTGIRRTHEDLATNVWVNPAHSSYGWNAIAPNNAPADDEGHGSLVSGVLGAAGNNGKGVVGVAWRVQIMAAKCFDASKNGSDSDIIECVEFARTNGARIMNMSFSDTAFSASLSNAVWGAREAGIIVVASSGNEGADVDRVPRYPACLELDNVISVAATTRNDGLWAYSNYGATNVDLAAPGDAITSTFAFTDTQYLGPLAGTSLAAPYVSGVCALLLARYPGETHQQIIARVLAAVDPVPALAGKCVTGGRLNLRRALSPDVWIARLSANGELPLELQVGGGPNRRCVVEVTTDLATWTAVATNTTSAAGTFDFVDTASMNSPRRFFRAVSTP